MGHGSLNRFQKSLWWTIGETKGRERVPALAIGVRVSGASVASSVRSASWSCFQSRQPLGGAVHGIGAGEGADEAADLATHR